jgi:glycosyltransferase involved in cell wall biosynthesis
VVHIRKPNGGAASARNLGIEQAHGDWIAFLDADDLWYPTKLEGQLEVCRRHPEVGLVAGRFHTQKPDEDRTDATSDRGNFDRVLQLGGDGAFELGTQIWTGTVLIRRDALAGHRFVPGLEPAEDRDLWIRLASAVPVYLISEPLAVAVLEPNSLSRSNIDVDCGNMLRVIDRHRALLSRRALRYWQAYTYRRWAANHLAQGHPEAAFRPAVRRLRLQPWSCEAWWVVAKCGRQMRARATPAAEPR